MEVDPSNDAILDILEPWTKIIGLQLSALGNYGEGIAHGYESLISHCIIKDIGAPSSGGISSSNKAYNCILIDCKNGINANYIYNCTVVHTTNNGNVGIQGLAKNCIVEGYTGTGDFSSCDAGSDYNISSDSTAPGAHSTTSTSVSFINSDSDDFHLSSSDTSAKDAGISDPGSGLFSDDIDSETRSNHSWDIGADEAAEKIYRSVGPSASSALETGTGNDLTISGSTATFTIDLGDDVGVGDAIQYDTAGAGADPVDAICFIHGRTDETHYTVKNSLGGAPTATIADLHSRK